MALSTGHFVATNKDGMKYHIGRGLGALNIVGCKIPPVDGFVAVCPVLTMDFHKGSPANSS